MSSFQLRCQHPECGTLYEGLDGFRLRCDRNHSPSLLLPQYETRQITVHTHLPGIFKYTDWLPTGGWCLASDGHEMGEPFCYKSEGMAECLGLKNLFIAFSGYWPEKGPNLATRTFKEFEVQCSLAYSIASRQGEAVMPFIISSAGNTANSFNLYTSFLGLPLYLFVPESGLDNLQLQFPTNPFVIAVKGDYSNAIELAGAVAKKLSLTNDGGVLNVGRRGGMATVMLNAVLHPKQGSQRLYDHYFQGVGSASGAIAAWEAVKLLLQDNRFGEKKTKIHMAQNSPFTPIPDAWEAGKSVSLPEGQVQKDINAVTAMVLTNRQPPFDVAGGIKDVLSQSGGRAWRVTNQNIFHSSRLFRAHEGVDIGPAAAVAVDALRQAVEAGAVSADDYILLHVTGGGREIQYSQEKPYYPKPRLTAGINDIGAVLEAIGSPQPISQQTVDKILKPTHQ